MNATNGAKTMSGTEMDLRNERECLKDELRIYEPLLARHNARPLTSVSAYLENAIAQDKARIAEITALLG